MLTEREMEDAIAADPQKYLQEERLELVARQYRIGSYIFDLLFRDRHGAKLIVELQRGTLDRNHTYKILDYHDEYKEQHPDEFVDLMVVANKIPRERQRRLTSYGIEFREIPESAFLGKTQGQVPVESGPITAQAEKQAGSHLDVPRTIAVAERSRAAAGLTGNEIKVLNALLDDSELTRQQLRQRTGMGAKGWSKLLGAATRDGGGVQGGGLEAKGLIRTVRDEFGRAVIPLRYLITDAGRRSLEHAE